MKNTETGAKLYNSAFTCSFSILYFIKVLLLSKYGCSIINFQGFFENFFFLRLSFHADPAENVS